MDEQEKMVCFAQGMAHAMGPNDTAWKRGQSAAYFSLNPKWGAKFYRSVEEREYCFNLQFIANQHDLAPPIGDLFTTKIQIVFGLDRTAFGFLTGHADVSKWKSGKAKSDLQTALLKIGIDNKDIWTSGNTGYYDGKLVCIDFDCALEIK